MVNKIHFSLLHRIGHMRETALLVIGVGRWVVTFTFPSPPSFCFTCGRLPLVVTLLWLFHPTRSSAHFPTGNVPCGWDWLLLTVLHTRKFLPTCSFRVLCYYLSPRRLNVPLISSRSLSRAPGVSIPLVWVRTLRRTSSMKLSRSISMPSK